MTDLYRVTTTITGTYVSGGGVTSHYFDTSTGTAAQCCAAVNGLWNYNAAIFASGTIFSIAADVDVIDDATGDLLSVGLGTSYSVTGTGTGEVSSPATQGLIRWRTGTVSDGREIRGRTFLPAVPVSQNDDGAPIAGYKSAVNTAAGLLISDANSAFAIWRRPRKARPQVGSPGDPWYLPAQSARDGDSAVVTSGTVWDKWAVMRSRRD